MKWQDYEDIGITLFDKSPDLDPLSVRFTELHEMVCNLEGFDDDPLSSDESSLEAIQMAWYEEYKESHHG